MIAQLARGSAVAGLIVLAATVAFCAAYPDPTHGTGVVPIVFATAFAGLAVTCLVPNRLRRERPSMADQFRPVYILMLVATLSLCWVFVDLLRQRLGAR